MSVALRVSFTLALAKMTGDAMRRSIYAPMISASSAAAAGVGINLITDSASSVASYAWGSYGTWQDSDMSQ